MSHKEQPLCFRESEIMKKTNWPEDQNVWSPASRDWTVDEAKIQTKKILKIVMGFSK